VAASSSSNRGRLVVAVAALVWIGAVLWTVWMSVERPPPARQVRFEGPNGSIDGGPIGCHGPAFVDGAYVWQECQQQDGTTQRSHLARFDLTRGVAELGEPLSEPLIQGVARAADGLVVVGRETIELRSSSGSVRAIGTCRIPRAVGVIDGEVEVVDGLRSLRIQRRRSDGSWSTRTIEAPPAGEGDSIQAEAVWIEDGRWRFAWSRTPEPLAAYPGRVALIEQAEGEAPRVVETLSLEGPPLRREANGATWLDRGWLHAARSGMFEQSAHAAFERRDGRWAPLDLAPAELGALRRLDTDGVLEADGTLRTFLRSDLGRRVARIEGRWYRLHTEPVAALEAIGAQRGPPLTTSFWLSIGTRILPDPRGGFWVMGSLGESYVHVDEALVRDDGFSLLDRVARLFAEDRAKRNAGHTGVQVPLRAIASLSVVGLPFFFVPIVLLTARGRRMERVTTLATLYLVVAIGLAYWFQRVVRFYW
jgi:hypothetical protein